MAVALGASGLWVTLVGDKVSSQSACTPRSYFRFWSVLGPDPRGLDTSPDRGRPAGVAVWVKPSGLSAGCKAPGCSGSVSVVVTALFADAVRADGAVAVVAHYGDPLVQVVPRAGRSGVVVQT